jgi:transcriptional regulator with XRE-family HTH domain
VEERDVALLVGARIRAERRRRAPPMTLAELAGTELSIGLVSRIERGLVAPSLSTLATVARRLGVPLASLFSADEPDPAAPPPPADALRAARATILVGDAAAAGRLATEAAACAAGAVVAAATPIVRARLLAVAAEAEVVGGNLGTAAAHLAGASGSLPVSGLDGGEATAQAELSFVLGLAEQRRGDRAAAERAWTAALDFLERVQEAGPAERLLQGRLLLEMAALNDAAGALETARNFLARAAAVLAPVADPAQLARQVLAAAGWLPAGPAPGDDAAVGRRSMSSQAVDVAAALAVVAAAMWLADRAAQDLTRLDRLTRRDAATPPAVASHSRHLR